MIPFESIVERILIFKDDKLGQEHPITIRVGRPYWTEVGSEAACPVMIEGLIADKKDIYGIDPLGALEAALTFINSFLSGRPENQQFYWSDGENYFD